jgi:hypothetical protein
VCDGCTLESVTGGIGGCIAVVGVFGGSRVGLMSEQLMCCWKILDSWRECWRWLSGKGDKGEAGKGRRRACVRSWTAAMAMLVGECRGMMTVVGNHARVLATRSALVVQSQTR